MIRPLTLLAALSLAACGQGDEPAGNSVSTVKVVGKAEGESCAAPTLAMADNAQVQSALMDETGVNFARAFKSACDKGLLAERPLIDLKATDQARIFLVNAPEANVASIYLSDIDGRRMVLEYPFLTTDGKSQVPTADELEEAIYCAVRGATAEEQEASGKCLVD